MALSREDIGTAYFRLDDYAAAQEQYAQALVLWREVESNHGVASVLWGIGQCKLATQQVAEAMALFGEALERYKALDSESGMFDVYVSLADGAIALQDEPAAIQHLQQALAIDKELGGPYAGYIRERLQELGVVDQPQRKSRAGRSAPKASAAAGASGDFPGS